MRAARRRWGRRFPLILAALASIMIVGCHDTGGRTVEPPVLPACFALEVGAWSVPPEAEYRAIPRRLVLASFDHYSRFHREVVGRVALLMGPEVREGAWAWRTSEGGSGIEVFQDPPGFGGNVLTLTGQGRSTLSGRLEWFSDWGTGGMAAVTVREERCSNRDRAMLDEAAARGAAS